MIRQYCLGLTALAIWILSTILLVFTALLLYIAVLINMRRKISSENEKGVLDLDPIFLVVHLALFAIFLLTYTIVFASI